METTRKSSRSQGRRSQRRKEYRSRRRQHEARESNLAKTDKTDVIQTPANELEEPPHVTVVQVPASKPMKAKKKTDHILMKRMASTYAGKMLMAARPDIGTSVVKTTKLIDVPKPTTGERNAAAQVLDLDPSLLEEYCQDCILGEGRFGEVKLMKYRTTIVAVKRMKNKKYNYLIHREAEVLRQLGDHPGLPYLYGVCEKGGEKLLILEYCEDEVKPTTLNQAVLEKKIPSNIWPDIIKMLGKTMVHMHSKGIIHGDMKGDNVLIVKRCGNWCPVIIDFGKCTNLTSTVQESKERSENLSERKVRYPHIAPEVLSGNTAPSVLSDAYSFGRIAKHICRRNFDSCQSILGITKTCCVSDLKSRSSIKLFLGHLE